MTYLDDLRYTASTLYNMCSSWSRENMGFSTGFHDIPAFSGCVLKFPHSIYSRMTTMGYSDILGIFTTIVYYNDKNDAHFWGYGPKKANDAGFGTKHTSYSLTESMTGQFSEIHWKRVIYWVLRILEFRIRKSKYCRVRAIFSRFNDHDFPWAFANIDQPVFYLWMSVKPFMNHG